MFKKISNKDLEMGSAIRESLSKGRELKSEEKEFLNNYGFDIKSPPQYLRQDLSFALQPYYFLGANPTADCIIIRGDEILLIKRGEGTVEGGKWAIPGGFVNTAAKYAEMWTALESPIDAALRELQEETGASLENVKDNSLVPSLFVGIFEGNQRDPRDNELAWSKSHAFVFVIDNLPDDVKNQKIEGLDDADGADWKKISELPLGQMAFDHELIIMRALEIVKAHSEKLNLNSSKYKM